MIQDWVIILIQEIDNENLLRQRELFLANKLDTFNLNGLNRAAYYHKDSFLLI